MGSTIQSWCIQSLGQGLWRVKYRFKRNHHWSSTMSMQSIPQLVQKDTTEDHLTARQTLPNTSTLKSPQLIDRVHDHSTDRSLLPVCWSSTSQPVQMNSVLSSIQKKIPSLIRWLEESWYRCWLQKKLPLIIRIIQSRKIISHWLITQGWTSTLSMM